MQRSLAVAAMAACAVAAVASSADADAPPRLLDIGDRRFTHGQKVDAVAVCSSTRAVSIEWGPRAYEWRLPDGTLQRVLGDVRQDVLNSIACKGDLTVTARGGRVVLWRGRDVIAKATIEDALGSAIDGGTAVVVAGDGKVHVLDASGTRVTWQATVPGVMPLVAPRRVVSYSGKRLTWSTPARTHTIELPAAIEAIGDLGDGIAVVDAGGNVRVLTSPRATKPVFTIDVANLGKPRSIGGDRKWLAVGTTGGYFVQAKRGGKPGKPLHLLGEFMYSTINAIAIAGDHWLLGADDQLIHRIRSGATTYKPPARAGHIRTPWSVAFDGRWLVSVSSDALRVRSVDGKIDRVLTTPDTERPIRVGLTPSIVWARDDYRHLWRWRRRGLTALEPIQGAEAAAPLDDRRIVVWIGGKLATLDLATGKVGRRIAVTGVSGEPVIAAGGDLVAVFADDTAAPIQVFDIVTGKKLASLARDAETIVLTVAVAANGKSIAIGQDERLTLWTRGKTDTVRDVGTHVAPISALAFAGDGRIAAGDWNGYVRIWSPASATPLREFEAHTGMVTALAWSGSKLATAGADLRVQVSELGRE